MDERERERTSGKKMKLYQIERTPLLNKPNPMIFMFCAVFLLSFLAAIMSGRWRPEWEGGDVMNWLTWWIVNGNWGL